MAGAEVDSETRARLARSLLRVVSRMIDESASVHERLAYIASITPFDDLKTPSAETLRVVRAAAERMGLYEKGFTQAEEYAVAIAAELLAGPGDARRRALEKVRRARRLAATVLARRMGQQRALGSSVAV